MSSEVNGRTWHSNAPVQIRSPDALMFEAYLSNIFFKKSCNKKFGKFALQNKTVEMLFLFNEEKTLDKEMLLLGRE